MAMSADNTMTGDTIRTKALNTAREHWRVVLHFASWALAAIVAVSVANGKRQAHSEEFAAKFEAMSDKLDTLSGKVDEMALSQAEMKGTLTVVKDQVQSVVKFKTDITEGIKDASAVHVPKLTDSKGHRAKK